MFTFGILLMISVIHMTIVSIFFPHLWKFYHETNSRVFGPRKWKVILLTSAIVGAIGLSVLIWLSAWVWVLLGIAEIFGLINAYKMNKDLSKVW